jgi:hypothetical protein
VNLYGGNHVIKEPKVNAHRGENRSGIPVWYQIQIVQIPIFSDTDSGIFIFGTDTDNTRIL